MGRSVMFPVILVLTGASLQFSQLALTQGEDRTVSDSPVSGSSVSGSSAESSHVLDHKMSTLAGKRVNLAKKYEDKVVLIVNVASRCGLTPQYEELQALHEKYAKQGLVVLGFPCNQFGRQEPGNSAEIEAFCKQNYGVRFDMFEKIEVNGDGACDLYKQLTKLNTKPQGAGKISWNFEKFLVGRDGAVIARFGPRTAPSDKAITSAIEAAL